MNFDNSFSLEKMMKTAQKQMSTTGQRLSAIEDMVNQRLGGRSRASLLGAVVVSVAWAAAFLFAYHYYGHYIPEPFGLPLLCVTLALMAFLVVGYFVQLRYYGAILSARDRLGRLRGRLTMGQSSLSNNLKVFQGRRSAQWELPLEPGPSIDQEANLIETQLSSMEALSNGFIAKTKTFLYYVVCTAWAAVGSYALFDRVGSFLFEATGSATQVVMMVALVIVCIIEAVIAKALWGATNNDVVNVTLLAVLAGPVVFAILCALVVLVIAVVQAVLYIAAIIVGIACVLGSLSGG